MAGISHLQMRLDGLITANQTWSVNPKFSWPPGDGSIPTQAVMDAWAQAVLKDGGGVTLPATDLWSPAVTATGVTCSFVNNLGRQVVISKSVLTNPVVGTGSTGLPPQCSVTTSLQTNVPGRRARGRLYWPFLAADIDPTTLRMSLSETQGVASAVATWLQGIEDAWPGPEAIQNAVVSSVGATATPVVRVAVGDVIDTQRRRRDQFLENYATAPLT